MFRVSILLFAISPAQAIYYTGYTDWAALSPASKVAFVTGILDYLVDLVASNEPFRAALSQGTDECLIPDPDNKNLYMSVALQGPAGSNAKAR